jgi:hypothetical protein
VKAIQQSFYLILYFSPLGIPLLLLANFPERDLLAIRGTNHSRARASPLPRSISFSTRRPLLHAPPSRDDVVYCQYPLLLCGQQQYVIHISSSEDDESTTSFNRLNSTSESITHLRL